MVKSRLLLAPLTNWQCNQDGIVTDDEIRWLDSCARGGFSMVMTCAANVHPYGKAFSGQMGIYDDEHDDGLWKVAALIKSHGAVSSVQPYHGGARVRREIGGVPVGSSDMPELSARGLSLSEVEGARDDRRYGGSLENRSRLIFEVISGIRAACKPDFQIGLRLSMERYGVSLSDVREVAARAIREEEIDHLDVAVWDYKKLAQEAPFRGQTLPSVFTSIRGTRRVRY